MGPFSHLLVRTKTPVVVGFSSPRCLFADRPPQATEQQNQQNMDRFCSQHSHRGSSRAYRLVLARHCLDRDAYRQVADEIGDCTQCWHDTALAAVDVANNYLLRSGQLPGLTPDGVVSGPTVDELLGRIAATLQCEELDRRELAR
jgi:hypothetical protein